MTPSRTEFGLSLFVINLVARLCDTKFAPRIATRFCKFGNNVLNGWESKLIVEKVCCVEFFAVLRVADQCSQIGFLLLGHALDDRIAFRVNGRIAEWLVAASNSEETSRLLECLLAQFCDRCQLSWICKSLTGVAKGDDVLG